MTVMVTVLLSIVVHGVSVVPGIELYCRATAKLPPGAAEHDTENAGDPNRGNA
jgi:NhaP-type Na+/H+ or K+/H+ antiporter